MSAVMLLASCHTATKVTTATLNAPHPEAARYQSVVQNTFKYDAMQTKSKYTMGKTGLNGKFCLESGRRLCMQVNAPILGFEVARVEASQDSILLVDKYDKIYTVLRLADLYNIDDLSGHEMEALECIMLGRIYLPGVGPASSRDYNALTWSTAMHPDGTQGETEGVFQGNNYQLTYAIDGTGRLCSTLLAVGDNSVRWDYDQYIEVEKGKWIPTQETVTATKADATSITAGITLNSPELGESTWRDFEPTDAYRKVTPQELMDAIKSLSK